MSEVSYRNKGPTPQVHDNSKLQVRQGSPAHFAATSSAMKTEIRPIAMAHTMGAKSATLPPHLAGRQPAAVQPPHVLGGVAPSRAPGPPNVLGRAPAHTPKAAPKAAPVPAHKPGAVSPSRPKPGAVHRVPVSQQPSQQPSATPASASPTATPFESRLISPQGAVLLGQICEMFIASEQFSGRGDTELVKLGIKTLTDMHPLFPAGVEIPIPNVQPPAGAQGPSVVMVPLEPSAPPAAPGSQSPPVITPPAASAPPASETKPG